MGKLRHISPQGYTIINNDCLKDTELGIEERGLLLTLVSLPNDWIFSIAGLCKILPCGKDKIKSTLQKLEEKDYLRRVFSRSPNGRYDSIDYITCKGSKIGDLPLAENPHTVNPHTVNPHTENPVQLNNNINKISNVLNINQSIPDNCKAQLTMEDVEVPIDRIDRIDRNSSKKDNSLVSERQTYEQLVKINIDYDDIINSHPKSNLYYRKDIIDEICSIIIDTLCCTKATIRIGGNELPADTVKGVLQKLNYFHIHAFIERINNTYTEKIHMKDYVLTALYNIVTTDNISSLSAAKADGTIP